MVASGPGTYGPRQHWSRSVPAHCLPIRLDDIVGAVRFLVSEVGKIGHNARRVSRAFKCRHYGDAWMADWDVMRDALAGPKSKVGLFVCRWAFEVP